MDDLDEYRKHHATQWNLNKKDNCDEELEEDNEEEDHEELEDNEEEDNEESYHACKIAKFFTNLFLPSVVNMSDEVLKSIPGRFRLRLKFTDKNREQVEEKVKKPVKIKVPVKIEKPKIVNKYNEDIDKALEMSKKEIDDKDITEAIQMSLQNDDTDTELYKAIMSSLNLCCEELEEKEDLIEYEEEDLIEYEEEDLIEYEEEDLVESEEEYEYPGEEYVYNEELAESFENDSNKSEEDIFEHISSDNEDVEISDIEVSESSIISSDSEEYKEGFYVCVDLQYYSKCLYHPIFVNGEPFYLRIKQIKQIEKLWKRIDPETRSGIIYSQKLEMGKAMVVDKYG